MRSVGIEYCGLWFSAGQLDIQPYTGLTGHGGVASMCSHIRPALSDGGNYSMAILMIPP